MRRRRTLVGGGGSDDDDVDDEPDYSDLDELGWRITREMMESCGFVGLAEIGAGGRRLAAHDIRDR